MNKVICNQDLEFINMTNTSIKDIIHHYNQNCIEDAYKMISQLEKKIGSYNPHDPKITELVQIAINDNMQIFKEIKSLYSKLKHFLDLMYEDKVKIIDMIDIYWHEIKEYTIQKTKNNIIVKHKLIKPSYIFLKLEGKLEVPLLNLISLINEPEYYSRWIPFCKNSHTIKMINQSCKAAYMTLQLPAPLKDREIYFVGQGIDRLSENGTIVIMSNSFHEDKEFMSKNNIQISKSTKYITINQKCLLFEIKPLNYNEVQVKILLHIDSGMKFIPISLLNWVATKDTIQILNQFLVVSLIAFQVILGFFETLIAESNQIKENMFEKYQNDPEKKDYYTSLKNRIDSFFQGSIKPKSYQHHLHKPCLQYPNTC